MTGDKDNQTVTAAMLVIGDEILSGRTRDKNAGHLATMLTIAGIELTEIRFVPDDPQRIVDALNALRSANDYVFTSGGIGPTHDDITADAVSAAFGVDCRPEPSVMEMLAAHYADRGMPFTPARQRMARMPEGAVPIENRVSKAPGFTIGNVHVMAGVPSVFEAMLDSLLGSLRTGAQIISQSIDCRFGEGDIGDLLGDVQKEHPDVAIGSYPRWDENGFSTQIVLRSRSRAELEAASQAVTRMLETLEQANT